MTRSELVDYLRPVASVPDALSIATTGPGRVRIDCNDDDHAEVCAWLGASEWLGVVFQVRAPTRGTRVVVPW